MSNLTGFYYHQQKLNDLLSQSMKHFLVICAVLISTNYGCNQPVVVQEDQQQTALPNIIYIMADDLGYQELGSYGQQIINTPWLDTLANEGMRFTQFYAGSTVCAPSRCSLLTGKHTGNGYVRDNYELGDFTDENEGGQLPLPEDTFTLGRMLQSRGYYTGAIGKWGLGGPGSSGVPNQQGFDYFYGYLCQKQAHNYYPTHLWENQQWDTLTNHYFHPHQKFEGDPTNPESFEQYQGEEYSQDLMAARALEFIDQHQDHPFFLYLPFPVPHLALQVPQESIEPYLEVIEDEPYLGDASYLPHQYPKAAYAGMITRMDQQIGQIMNRLKENGLYHNTVVIFTSDNGTTFDIGGVDRKYFNSLGPLRGHKTTLFEGGIRVPFIVRWPGKVTPGSKSDHISANWDVLPTIAEIIDYPVPEDVDGISFLPTLLSKGTQPTHKYLYWEYHNRWDGAQALRMGPWKAVRLEVSHDPPGAIQLYHLIDDIGEQHDVSAAHPEVVDSIRTILGRRSKSHIEEWNFNGNQL